MAHLVDAALFRIGSVLLSAEVAGLKWPPRRCYYVLLMGMFSFIRSTSRKKIEQCNLSADKRHCVFQNILLHKAARG